MRNFVCIVQCSLGLVLDMGMLHPLLLDIVVYGMAWHGMAWYAQLDKDAFRVPRYTPSRPYHGSGSDTLARVVLCSARLALRRPSLLLSLLR